VERRSAIIQAKRSCCRPLPEADDRRVHVDAVDAPARL